MATKQMGASVQAAPGVVTYRTVRLSSVSSAERAGLLERYEREVYVPAFPDAEIREDPAYWRNLLDADHYPPAPQPLIEVLLLIDEHGSIGGGVTIELYREAGAGLLTYISVEAARRGQGLGKRLIAEARQALNQFSSPETLMFAETERLEDAHDEVERQATITRQRRLAALGARSVDFDYIMPPLRADTQPHRLHLIVFDNPPRVPAATVLRLLDELARALGTNLAAFADTKAMKERLAQLHFLYTKPLPASGRD